MAAEVEDGLRPNIRIEIHNNLSENMEMDVDESSRKSDNEEGEISDEDVIQINSTSKPDNTSSKLWPSTRAIFTTGINIFDKDEQEKLQERARRFALKPEEIHMFTDEDLQQLHESLGITSENECQVRFDAVHMLGIKEMAIEDILEYFVKYAPNEIEWVSEDSCNIVWLENISAARAMHYNSKYVRGMPVRVPSDPFVREFLDEVEEPEKETGESILLKNRNREVELKLDDDILISQKKTPPKNSVDISEITIPVPPGYWRLGQKDSKSKCILLRYALKIDKQPFKTESLLKYYKKVASKNVISESKKKEIRSIFERNKDFNQDKNPWGSLAKNWDKDAKFREREPIMPIEEQKIEIKNPKILARLGVKRPSDEAEDEDKNIMEVKDTIIQERKKLKIPRMRMYADEEEEKLKRKKVLQSIKQQTEKIAKEDSRRDLRSVLGIGRRPIIEDKLVDLDSTSDLGVRLKNRNKNMIFALEHDIYEDDVESIEEPDVGKERLQEDIRELLTSRNKYRDRSPIHRHHVHRRISPPSPVRRERSHSRERSIERRRRRKSVERRYHATSYPRRRQSAERTLHSDRMTYESNRVLRYSRRHRSHSYEQNRYATKPKSKVAVVIKTQKKPTVASTVWSRVTKPSDSEESSSDSGSESESDKSSSSSSESESEGSQSDSSIENTRSSLHARPGFDNIKRRVIDKLDHRSPLKITMTNEHFKK